MLDGDGEVMLDDSVVVSSNEDHSLRVYRQDARTSYSCSPTCEPKVAIGDSKQISPTRPDKVEDHDKLSQAANSVEPPTTPSRARLLAKTVS